MLSNPELPTRVELEVEIPAGPEPVHADLVAPPHARGLVIFAHGSGSSRHSPRSVEVARDLQRQHLASLLLDLLTVSEDQRDRSTREHRFDIALLAQRLALATRWCKTQAGIDALPIGFFGASTGSAAALVAAAQTGDAVRAIVSRGGRPDLAGDALPHVRAATLLIVGSRDDEVLDLNRKAFERLACTRELVVVPGATHLFEEPGTLQEVSRFAGDWFARHLGAQRR
jgi:pimeloyl-ACP methyl ester carboxylesterase